MARLVSKAASPGPMHLATLGRSNFNRGTSLDFDRVSPDQLVRRYGMWVHRAVTLNASAAAAVPVKLYTIDRGGMLEKGGRSLSSLGASFCGVNKRQARHLHRWAGRVARKAMRGQFEDLVEIEMHPVLDLLGDVNEWTDGYSWRESVYADLQVFGRHFSVLINERKSEALPDSMWRMQPQKMQVIPSMTDFVESFKYGSGDTEVMYSPDEVLWFRLFDPFNPWGGMGPLEAWLRTVDASHAMAAFQDDLFKRGGSPDWVAYSKAMPTEPQKRQFLSEWRKAFGKWFKRERTVAFMAGEDARLERLSDSPKELDFTKSQDQMRDMIGQAFGVPKALLTTDDVNRANLEGSRQIHTELTLWPMIQRVEDTLNERLVSRFSESVFIIHESPIGEDQAERQAERASKLIAGWSVNEIRTEEGAEALDDEAADLPLIGSTSKPLELLTRQIESADRLLEAPLVPPGGARPPAPGEGEGEDRPPSGEPEERSVTFTVTEFKGILGDAISAAATAAVEVAASTWAGRVDAAVAALGPAAGNGHGGGQAGGHAGGDDLPGAGVDGKAVAGGVVSQREHWRKQLEAGEPENEPGDTRLDRAFADALAGVLRRQVDEVADRLESIEQPVEPAVEGKTVNPGPLDPDTILDPETLARWQAELRTVSKPHIRAALAEAAARALEEVARGDAPGITFDPENVLVREYLERTERRIGRALTDTFRDQIRPVLVEGVSEGLSSKEIAKRLREQVDAEFTKAKAEMISRTEMAFASIHGTEMGWRQTSVVVGKQFVLAPDACEWCQAVADELGDGRGEMGKSRTFDLGQPFFDRGHVLKGTFTLADGTQVEREMVLDYSPDDGDLTVPPVHPHCRCAMRPVLEGE